MILPAITPRAQARLTITVLVFLMVQAVAFGFPTILTLAYFQDQAEVLIPAIVALSIPVSLYVSWKLAPSLRARIEPKSTRPDAYDEGIAFT